MLVNEDDDRIYAEEGLSFSSELVLDVEPDAVPPVKYLIRQLSLKPLLPINRGTR